MKTKLEEKLHKAHIILENALTNPVLAQKLEKYKYDRQRLMEGKDKYDNVMVFHTRQQKEYGEQFDATDALQLARDEAHTTYMKHVTIAKVALEHKRGAWKSLQLEGQRKRSLAGWLQQATIFYENIGGVTKEMEAYGIAPEELTQGQAMIQAVANASVKQQQEKEEAVKSTKKRNEALQELNQWMKRFMRIARLALQDEVKELETKK